MAEGSGPAVAEGPVKVTVSDPKTGRILQEKIIENDYTIVTCGDRYLKHVQVWGSAHILTIARRKK